MDEGSNRLIGFACLLVAAGSAIYVGIALRQAPFYWAFPVVLAISGLTMLARLSFPDLFPDWLPERRHSEDDDSPSRRDAEDRELWN